MTDVRDYEPQTPWQADRDRAERTSRWPEAWGPFHRHFANDAIHRDGGPECDQPGTPRRVYVFDEDALDAHELAVARYAIGHPDQFGREDPMTVTQAELAEALEAYSALGMSPTGFAMAIFRDIRIARRQRSE